jgi:hypothetical protein
MSLFEKVMFASGLVAWVWAIFEVIFFVAFAWTCWGAKDDDDHF